jgi:methyl-accepting chemotaxis protein
MSIQHKIKILYTVAITVIAALTGVIVLMSRNQQALNTSQNIRFQSHLLASELRLSSEDLTRLARTYVLTGDSKYEQSYQEVLAIRSGEKARPDGRKISLRGLMEESGFTAEEFTKLQEAEDKSNGLVRTETIAMNAVKGRFDDGTGQFTRIGEPDLDLARRVMHDNKYHADKAVIMRPIEDFDRMLDQRTKAAVDGYIFLGNLLLGAIAMLVLSGCALAFFIVRSVNAVLRSAIQELADSAQQVSGASSQVAATSLTLAEGSSRQAAALEETSASAEEIQTMTAKNADSSDSAAELMSFVDLQVRQGDASLAQMVGSMNEICDSSRRISKIIKVIDEIAFQTNILALNAAVEAARAGEAGAGFSVVADEVRSLAQRAAEAAKNTGALIEESMNRATEGSSRVGEVTKVFQTIIESTSRVKLLVDDVSASSREQSRGVQQISRAIMEMEQVTQSTAAHAEETAAATEQISAQAESLLKVATDLRDLVGGSSRS